MDYRILGKLRKIEKKLDLLLFRLGVLDVDEYKIEVKPKKHRTISELDKYPNVDEIIKKRYNKR